MKSIFVKGFLILLLIFLSSCTTNPFRPKEGQFLSRPKWLTERKQYVFTMGTVEIDTDLHENEIRRSAYRNLNLLLEEGNRKNKRENKRTAVVDLYLREYSFMKDFKPLKTLTLHLTAYDEEGNPLCSWYRSMETKESFFSSPYLYKQMNKGTGKLF